MELYPSSDFVRELSISRLRYRLPFPRLRPGGPQATHNVILTLVFWFPKG
ncbi:Hypothetical protein FKW44_007665 [Caligus rogercresseyi]|uniref:Uncharacterized protein n=1 Tax=Caligus rogercresseyi TaxID=217165 RepID=A0A7T8QTR8_CALRO|nr:Hypothetical protein FKW44_007665 [Caligus rogercresseyi]